VDHTLLPLSFLGVFELVHGEGIIEFMGKDEDWVRSELGDLVLGELFVFVTPCDGLHFLYLCLTINIWSVDIWINRLWNVLSLQVVIIVVLKCGEPCDRKVLLCVIEPFYFYLG